MIENQKSRLAFLEESKKKFRPATFNLIFDAFKQVDASTTRKYEGTGLGLSQVYGFVERSDGAIKIYSELGHGSRFTLYFPRYYGSKTDKGAVEANGPADLSGKETILVVDDEPVLLKLTSQILGSQGYHVICAHSSNKALQILERESVDLMLSDVIMPDMDGYQLAQIVHEKYPSVKIQLASGFADGKHADMVDETLHQNLLNKPYDIESLLVRIRELLN